MCAANDNETNYHQQSSAFINNRYSYKSSLTAVISREIHKNDNQSLNLYLCCLNPLVNENLCKTTKIQIMHLSQNST